MTTTLAVVSTVSELLARVLIKEKTVYGNHLVVLVNNTTAYNKLNDVGIFSFLVEPPLPKPVAERDREFFSFAMPGVMGDNVLFGTNLPVHKVLGIDRLRFWFAPGITDLYLSHIKHIDCDRLIIPLDMYDFFPWVAYLSKLQAAYIIGVKCHTLRRRVVLDLHEPFDEVVVSHELDKQILEIPTKGVVVDSPAHSRRIAIPEETQEKLKKELGIKARAVVGLWFDPRFEYNFRRFLMSLTTEGSPKIIALYSDSRNRTLLARSLPKGTASLVGLEYLPQEVANVCDQIFMFGFDEEVYCKIPENIKIVVVDYNNINKSRELAPDDVEVLID